MILAKMTTAAFAALTILIPLTSAHAAPEADCARYETVGQGPDVILVPGLGSSPDVWDSTVAALSDRFRFHLVKVLGFAGEPPEGDLEEGLPKDVPSRTARYIKDYISCRDLEQPAVVGHSMGGFTGLLVARDYPEMISQLVIIDALPFYSLIFDPNATEQSVAPQAAAMAQAVRVADDESFAQMQMRTASSLAQSQEDAETVAGWTIASDRETFASAIQSIMTTDLRPDLSAISAPVSVVYATNQFATSDRMTPLYETAYSALPDVSFTVIPDSYHFTMLDQPELTVQAIEAALADL